MRTSSEPKKLTNVYPIYLPNYIQRKSFNITEKKFIIKNPMKLR